MSRLTAMTALAGLVLLVAAQQAAAQGAAAIRPNLVPYYRPNLTPYLNLARGGTPAINYYLGTVTEEQRRYNFGYLNSSLQELDLRTQNLAREERLIDPIRPAQMRTAYGNLGPFYGNTGGFYGDNGPRYGVIQQPTIGQPVGRRR